MNGGGCTTCEYGPRLLFSGCTASVHASKPRALIGYKRSVPAFPCFTTSRGRRRMSVNAAATETLRKGIEEFYDDLSGIWENVWGDHIPHGFSDPDSDVSLSDHRSAQIRMIEEALLFASLSDDSMKKPRNIVDAGCGIGGSSRYLARKYGAN